MIPLFEFSNPTVVVVDDFLSNPDDVRQFALSQEFKHHPQYHKGARTEQRFHRSADFKNVFAKLLDIDISDEDWDRYDTNGVYQSCVAGDQLVYHSDHQRWAGAIYLTPDAPPESGLSIYRSKQMGGRTVDEVMARLSPDSILTPDAVADRMYGGKLLDRTAWEEIDRIGNRYNRLVLWNGKLVHAATEYFGHSLDSSRLFQMFFWG